MTQRHKLGLAVVLLLISGVAAYSMLRPPPAPRLGEAAEIIHPITHERHQTTWDQVAKRGVRDLSPGGGWMMPYPGANDLWGYVVNRGEQHPSETQPVTRQTGHIHGPVD